MAPKKILDFINWTSVIDSSPEYEIFPEGQKKRALKEIIIIKKLWSIYDFDFDPLSVHC